MVCAASWRLSAVDMVKDRFTVRHGMGRSINIIQKERNSAMANTQHKFIMDLEHLNRFNSEGCPACGQKFSLGDPVVVACGAWEGGAKVIHENEAVFDHGMGQFIERKCYSARKKTNS
jgi:hypothetical protein